MTTLFLGMTCLGEDDVSGESDASCESGASGENNASGASDASGEDEISGAIDTLSASCAASESRASVGEIQSDVSPAAPSAQSPRTKQPLPLRADTA